MKDYVAMFLIAIVLLFAISQCTKVEVTRHTNKKPLVIYKEK
jgi:hypothetical protein